MTVPIPELLTDQLPLRRGLTGLAEELSAAAERLRPRTTAARDFIKLMTKAQEIGAQAREMSLSKWARDKTISALTANLRAFAEEAAAASIRAGVEAESQNAVSTALLRHARRLVAIAQECESESLRAVVRSTLQPLLVELTNLQPSPPMESVLYRDAQKLAEQASWLANESGVLNMGGRSGEAAAREVCTALHDFAIGAKLISAKIIDGAEGMRKATLELATRTRELSGHILHERSRASDSYS